ncbi:TPA: hypothetical protein HA231_03905 [Candidatus Woesearchaeota archaeon]|nr:hypothetical protein [Candidatus Woesearchaeota archaeon]
MDYSYTTTKTNLGLQTTVSCERESYSQVVLPNMGTIRTLSPGRQSGVAVLNHRAFGDNVRSYDYFSSISRRLEELAGTAVPHTTADFEDYMSEGLSLPLPELSADLRINLDDVMILSRNEQVFRQVSRHLESASSRWGFATDAVFAVALAAVLERPVTVGIYGAMLAVMDLAIGAALGSWKYAPTHALGYLSARKLHKDEMLNNPNSLIEAYTGKVGQLETLRKSVGNAAEIERLQGEVAIHFQMLKELFTSASSQKGLVISIRDGPGTETAMGRFEKILLENPGKAGNYGKGTES